MKGKKKKLVKMLRENKLISVNQRGVAPQPEEKVRTEDLEILKQIVDDVSDIENTKSDNEINELLVKKDRASFTAGIRTPGRYDSDCVKYESIVSLNDTSRLCPESEKRKEKVKKTIDEVNNKVNIRHLVVKSLSTFINDTARLNRKIHVTFFIVNCFSYNFCHIHFFDISYSFRDTRSESYGYLTPECSSQQKLLEALSLKPWLLEEKHK